MKACDVETLADLDRYLVETRRAVVVKCVRPPVEHVPAAVKVELMDGRHTRRGFGQTFIDALCDAEECLEAEVRLEAEAENVLDR